ncbi:MAG: type VI secretion system lipoprotein TssJ, partial [Planctomycetota bacterium]
FVMVVLGLIGCGSRQGSLAIKGVTPLNLNDLDESTPVTVRIYQLKAAERFRGADFGSLWSKDTEVLGGDRLGDPAVTTVLPGATEAEPQTVSIGTLSPEARFIGVMALFSKTDAQGQRTVVIPRSDLDDAVVILTGYSVRLTTD